MQPHLDGDHELGCLPIALNPSQLSAVAIEALLWCRSLAEFCECLALAGSAHHRVGRRIVANEKLFAKASSLRGVWKDTCTGQCIGSFQNDMYR